MATITFTGARFGLIRDLDDQLTVDAPQQRAERHTGQDELNQYSGGVVGVVSTAGFVATVTYTFNLLTRPQFLWLKSRRGELAIYRDEGGHLDYGVLHEVSGYEGAVAAPDSVGRVNVTMLLTTHDAKSFITL